MNSINWCAADIREDSAIEYQHRAEVLTFPSPHAKANAAYAAQLLETDRMELDRDRLIRELGALIVATRRKEEELATLNAALGRRRS